MDNHQLRSDMSSKDVVVVFKHSRYSYVLDRGTDDEKRKILLQADDDSRALRAAHENNLLCIENITKALTDLRIKHTLICRSDLQKSHLADRFVISIGGDGTMLDCSHYCDDSPILGINSDPGSSIGALCAANGANFVEVMREIYDGKLTPTRLTRLAISIDGQRIDPLATNDVLFSHHNPASLTRFSLRINDHEEAHRSSGIWIATAAGSTGGIYSAGATPIALDDNRSLFHIREPYWVSTLSPQFLAGSFAPEDKFVLTCTMTDGALFVDGPHEQRAISWGQTVEISSDAPPLWLFDGPRLMKNREKIIERRKAIHQFLS